MLGRTPHPPGAGSLTEGPERTIDICLLIAGQAQRHQGLIRGNVFGLGQCPRQRLLGLGPLRLLHLQPAQLQPAAAAGRNLMQAIECTDGLRRLPGRTPGICKHAQGRGVSGQLIALNPAIEQRPGLVRRAGLDEQACQLASLLGGFQHALAMRQLHDRRRPIEILALGMQGRQLQPPLSIGWVRTHQPLDNRSRLVVALQGQQHGCVHL